MDPLSRRTVDEAVAIVAEFETYLASFGASPKAGSQLQRSIAEVRGLPAAVALKVYPAGSTPLTRDAPALAVVALASQVLRARGTPLETKLRQRLKALSKGTHLPLPSANSSVQRNSVLETLAACAVAPFATNVDFAEPDVTCEFEGARWGLAAKVAYGNAESVADLVDDGRRQVDNQAADGKLDKGAVLLDLTNHMPNLLQQAPGDSTKWNSFVTAADVESVVHGAHERALDEVLHAISPPRKGEPTVAIVSVSFCMARLLGVPTIARVAVTRVLPQETARPSGLIVVTWEASRRFLEPLVDGLRVG